MEITAAQREKDLLILNSLASKSKLTEKDVKEIKEDLTITKEDLTITKDKVFVIESEILDVKKKLENIVYRHELEAVKDRIAEIEKRAGIKK